MNPQTLALLLHERFGLDLIRHLDTIVIPADAREIAKRCVLACVEHAAMQRAGIEALEATIQ